MPCHAACTCSVSTLVTSFREGAPTAPIKCTLYVVRDKHHLMLCVSVVVVVVVSAAAFPRREKGRGLGVLGAPLTQNVRCSGIAVNLRDVVASCSMVLQLFRAICFRDRFVLFSLPRGPSRPALSVLCIIGSFSWNDGLELLGD